MKLAPPLIEALLRGGADGRSPDDRIEAAAAVQWLVWLLFRLVRLLETLCRVWGVKDP